MTSGTGGRIKPLVQEKAQLQEDIAKRTERKRDGIATAKAFKPLLQYPAWATHYQ